jgi:putative ABC transport system substrate-binding protein
VNTTYEQLSRVATFKDELRRLGWIEGRNIIVDVRFAGGVSERFRAHAHELVGLAPDLLIAQSGASARAMQAQTKTIPIVFVEVGDPTGSGFVQSLTHPEGNSTGFSVLFYSIGGKWLELLKEAAPHVVRVALLVNAGLGGLSPGGSGYLPAIEAAAKAYSVEVVRLPYERISDLERAINEFAAVPNGGVIVVPPTPTESDQEMIRRSLVPHQLPAVYQYRLSIESGGGLISYGPDTLDLFRGAASYADRILKGAKPSDLPVQFPTRFELVVNLKTAKAIGLTVPPSLLARADEVIE